MRERIQHQHLQTSHDLLRRRIVLLILLAISSYSSFAIEDHGDTALMRAAYEGDLTTVERLVKNGADVNQPNKAGMTPLWAAAGGKPQTDHLSPEPAKIEATINRLAAQTMVLRFLIDHGANVDARPPGGLTPLMAAVNNFNHISVKVLLDHGADVNAQTRFGDTALMYAASRGYSEIALTLLDHGALLNGPVEINGRTPLIAAIAEGHFTLAKTLLDRGAAVNVADHDGATPLLLAVIRNRPDLVGALLGHGADFSARTRVGETPLTIATKQRQSEVITLLKEAGAKE